MRRIVAPFLLLITLSIASYAQKLVVPTHQQLEWQQLETTAFLHFTINTFTDREWGDGTENPSVFNPTAFNAGQIVKVLKETGFKLVILTAKHHDGFCLWPSAYTEHSVKNSPWQHGDGDIVREISDACHKYGLKFGFYLSPWDRNNDTYGTDEYNIYYKNQLKELLTNYGKISEVWLDGAKGENARNMDYDFYGYWKLVRHLQPEALLFSDAGPDIRWVGNENGFAGETCWSTIDTTGMAPGKADPAYLNTGDSSGSLWIPAETDVSIRPGWFYHSSEDNQVRSVSNLVDLYYKSVGRNSLLLLNIPPDRRGLLHEEDVRALYGFRAALNETFEENLAEGNVAEVLTDHDIYTYVTLQKGEPYELNFNGNRSFDRISLQENIADGQRNEEAKLEFWNGHEWKLLVSFSTIGHKRLLRIPAVTTSRTRLTVLDSKQPVELSEIGFYKSSSKE